MIQELRLSCDVSPERAESGPKRLLGLATSKEVEQLRLLQPSRGPSWQRIFSGMNWDDVLVIPFRDLPQRLCGFLCVGRNGDPEKDVVYQSMGYHGTSSGGAEGGLAMHPDVPSIAQDWDNTVLVTDNAVRMLQVQFRHFEQSTHPLPIAAWFCGRQQTHTRTKHAWQMLSDKSLVFWMPFPSAEVLSQAIAQNGKLCTHGPLTNDSEGWRLYLNKMSSRDLFKRLVTGAKHWTEVVADLAATAEDSVLEELFLQLSIHGVALDRVLKLCPSTAKRRIMAVLARSTKGATVSMNGIEIYEKDDAWWTTYKNKQELVADAVLQITEIVHHSQSKKFYYRGYIKRKGKKYPFCELKDTVDRNTFKWMESYLLEAGGGQLRSNPHRSRVAVAIALQFREPTYTKAIDVIGWQASSSQFVLPRYTLSMGGAVSAHDIQIFSHTSPARMLLIPEDLSGLDTNYLLGDKRVADLLWATLIPLLGNIVAEACNEQTVGIGLRGPGAEAMGEAVADAIGCLASAIGAKRDVDSTLDLEHRHNWPLLVQLTPKCTKPVFQGWLESDRRRPHNAIAPLDWWQYTYKSIAGAWTLIEADHGAPLKQEAVAAIRKFLPAYLKDLASRNMQLADWRDRSDNWLLDLAKDVQRFLKPTDDNAHRVVHAMRLVRPYHENGNADGLADLLSEMVTQRQITLIREGFEQPGHSALLQTEQGLLVSRGVLVAALAKNYLSPPDPLRLTAVLAHAGVLKEERETGWVIDEAWWQECHKRRRALGSGHLKIHG